MTNVLLMLGTFKFATTTAAYDELERVTSYRWRPVEVIGAETQQQYIGGGGGVIKLPGVVYPSFSGGVWQIEDMRRVADAGRPLVMVTGFGLNLGLWCVTSVKEVSSRFLKGGIPRKMEFEVDIVSYGRKAP